MSDRKNLKNKINKLSVTTKIFIGIFIVALLGGLIYLIYYLVNKNKNNCLDKGNQYSYIESDKSCLKCDDNNKITDNKLLGKITYNPINCLIDSCPTGYVVDTSKKNCNLINETIPTKVTATTPNTPATTPNTPATTPNTPATTPNTPATTPNTPATTTDSALLSACTAKGTKYSYISSDMSCPKCDTHLKLLDNNLLEKIEYKPSDCVISKCPSGYTLDTTGNKCIITSCTPKTDALSYDTNCKITKCTDNFYIDSSNDKCVACSPGTYSTGDSTTCMTCTNNSNVSSYK